MKIAEVHIKGFRNFKDAKFNFNNHTAIMGFNDIGKTNLIYALRLLLDKNISEADMELSDSDFFVHEDTTYIEITIKFDEVIEDFVLAKIRENVSANGELYLQYIFSKTNRDYKLLMGDSIASLAEIDGRFYLKAFNLKYVGSSRNLSPFIKKEKKYLLEKAKEARDEPTIVDDLGKTQIIERELKALNTKVGAISYVQNATNHINIELDKLSFRYANQKLVFDVAGDTIDTLLQKVDLSNLINDKLLSIGGDGALNQIFLALWTTKYSNEDLHEVSFYCIEEPEAHLHPHQQRKLSEYLAQTLDNQVIITTHSPQIISEFKANSIIKLFQYQGATYGANEGCSQEIDDELFNFAHRLDIISTEAFYANVVFLVEGQSEILFYKALAKATNIDLDKLNISILMVDGVGFKPYIRVLSLLKIPWVMRTDNDIFKIPRQENYRYAGIQRGIDIYRNFTYNPIWNEELEQNLLMVKSFHTPIPPPQTQQSSQYLINFLYQKSSIYIARKDLETDLVYSPLINSLKNFYGETNNDEILKMMQNRKGGAMFEFLCQHQGDLSILLNDPISEPLKRCKFIVEQTR